MNPMTFNRRRFLGLTTASVIGGLPGLWRPSLWASAQPPNWNPHSPLRQPGRPLRVQPVFMFSLPQRKEESSWKSWGGVQTEADVNEEVARIQRELAQLAGTLEFPVRFLPLVKVNSPEQASGIQEQEFDAVLVYACTGSGKMLQACLSKSRDNLIFVRHRSGPVYYWYEALSVSFLQTGGGSASTKPEASVQKTHVDDVVVDDYEELRWRLRALSGLRNSLGTRIVALGGVWGKYSAEAPQIARDKYRMEIIEVSYEALAPRLQHALNDAETVAQAEQGVDDYLGLPHTTLQTDRKFLVNAFVLYRLFRELMEEHEAPAFTIKSCMGTIIPMARTTACLTLSLLNDEGWLAFCESDFVVIPAGVLMRYLTGKPVFLHNSTFPHQRMVTCAHCTSPRRLDGRHYHPAIITTHYESEYGAAPKVEMPIGQEVTFLDPTYSLGRWVGFKGIVKDNPAYAICRSQQDVEIQGDWQKLVSEVRDSHWIMAYGDYLKEARYAARKLGVEWVSL